MKKNARRDQKRHEQDQSREQECHSVTCLAHDKNKKAAGEGRGRTLLPNFFIVGAPKAGTTSLYHYLDQHPQVFMSPVKEPCYFASEVRRENFAPEFRKDDSLDPAGLRAYLHGPRLEKRFSGLTTTRKDYCRLFEGVKDEIAIGEASVCYLWSPTAARNIAACIPKARIVAVLRHPAERAWSQYLHGVANGHVNVSFRQHIDACLMASGKEFSPEHPFLEFGMYYEQVRTYLEVFPRENLRIYFYDDGLRAILADLFRFLNIDPSFEIDFSRKYLESSAAGSPTVLYRVLAKYHIPQTLRKLAPGPVRPLFRKLAFRRRTVALMNAEDRRFLCAHYREDVTQLSLLLDRDLSSWLV